MAIERITKLTEHAVEKSTYIITATFYDDTETLVTPNSGLTWTLTDENGNVINSRSAVSISSASSVDIVLSGNDLALREAEWEGVRLVTVSGTYNSTAGSNLTLKRAAQFVIDSLAAV